MSKTDKTDPDWVRCWWEPFHHPRCVQNPARKVTWYECDLPPEPKRGGPIYLTWRALARHRRCVWSPLTPSYYSKRVRKFYGRPRSRSQDENLFERGVRAAWRDCAKKLSGTPIGEIDEVVLPDPRHRHNVLWWD